MCYRYSKNPQIRRLKIRQVWAARRHSDPLAVWMLRLEDFMEIQKLHHDGVSEIEIARQLDMDRKTVRKYLKQARREYERKPKVAPFCSATLVYFYSALDTPVWGATGPR